MGRTRPCNAALLPHEAHRGAAQLQHHNDHQRERTGHDAVEALQNLLDFAEIESFDAILAVIESWLSFYARRAWNPVSFPSAH